MKRRPLIVIVDDDPSVRKALQRLLRAAQLDVETYASGSMFLARSEDHDPDCMLVDVRMPGMSGPDLRNRLLQVGRRIPMIYITAHAEEVPEDPAADGDIPEVLLKPFDEQALLECIERCIRPPPRSP